MTRAAALLGVVLLAAVVAVASAEGGARTSTAAPRATGAAPQCHSRPRRHCGRWRDERVSSPPLPRRLGVDENEYSVYPTHNPVGAGSVEFDVTNFGMDAHDFSIRTSKGAVLSSTPLASRASAVVAVRLRPGRYTLFCSLLDHEARGMRATLVVR